MSSLLKQIAPERPAACAAVDLALSDLAAREAGLPLAHWWHRVWARGIDSQTPGSGTEDHATAVADHVAVNAVLTGFPLGELQAAATACVGSGFDCIKVKVGPDPSEAIARVAAVRRGIDLALAGDSGPTRRVAVRADANGAWDPETALEVLLGLDAYDIEYVEQPVPALDVEGLADVRLASPVPVAADEALLTPGGIERVLALDAADVWVLKPSLMGGPSAARLAAAMAFTAGASVVVTSALDSAVGRTGALHLAATLGGPHAAGLATGDLFERDVADTPPPQHGRLRITGRPGLGIDVDGPWRAIVL